MKKSVLIIAAVFFFGVANTVKAGDNETANHNVSITIPTVALVDIEGTTGNGQTVTLEPTVSSLEAGEKVDFTSATDNSLKLNYTSIVANGSKNKITASISQDLSNQGFDLKLSVSSDNTGGSGNLGDAVQNVVLGTTAADVVTNIGSCWSGDGSSKGRTLTYSLEEADYTKIIGQELQPITVTYTITAQN